MPLTRDVIRRAVAVAYTRGAGFVELVGMAELDRTTAFRGASMRGTNLRGEDLSGFDFTDADFAGADIRGADFTRATGLTTKMFRSARVDNTTKWPPAMQNQTSDKAIYSTALPLPAGYPRVETARVSLKFSQLLHWHLKVNGTRSQGTPGVPGRMWTVKEFDCALSSGIAATSGSKVRQWLNGRHLPATLDAIERELFGDNRAYDKLRADLRFAYYHDKFAEATTSIRVFGTESEDPVHLIGSPAWQVYEILFPAEEERDNPVNIIDWLTLGFQNSTEWCEIFFTLHYKRKCIGIAYLSTYRPRIRTLERPTGWWFGNYFGILKGYREAPAVGVFLSAITRKCYDILPESKGIIFEVQRYNNADMKTALDKFKKNKQVTLTEDEKFSIRAARKVGLTQGREIGSTGITMPGMIMILI
jgi:hypothetical protein